jgi:predicted nucleotidyltransferase
MLTTNEIINSLIAAKPELISGFKVHGIGIFGSVARGEHTETSDIDVLVDIDESADLFDLVGISQYLEECLNAKVDVVPLRSLRNELRDVIMSEARFL